MITALLLLLAAPTFTDVDGVKLHCSENIRGKTGNAKVEVVFAVGALSEDDDRQGEAHVLEHLALRPLGFDHSNGETSWDFTSYFSAVRASELGAAAKALLRTIREPPLEQRDLDIEREIVLREIDDRGAAQAHPLISQLFGGTAIDRPLGGSKATLENISTDSVAAFHQRHYVRANMAVVLAGAADCASLTASIAPELAAFERGTPTAPPTVDGRAPGQRDVRGSPGHFIGGFYWHQATASEEALMRVIGKHLQQRALDQLRKELGIAYSPVGRLVRLGGAGMVHIAVETDDRARIVAGWFDDTIAELRGSVDPAGLLANAVIESRRDLELDYPRLAIAAIRGEDSPVAATDTLRDGNMAKALVARTLTDNRLFTTPAGGFTGILVLILFGLGVLVFFGVLLKNLLSGGR